MSAPTEPSSPAPSPSAASLSHAEILTIIIGITLAMLLAALDQTIVATALPTIGSDLNDFANLSWVVTAYLLSSTAVTPLYGKLSDVFGRRVVLLFAIGVFMLGSLACALAPSMLALILARGLQGLGGGGLISLAQTIIADVVSPRERGRYQGYIASVFAASSIAGPVLGGVIADHLHWSLIFWINLPLGLAAFLMTERTLRRLPRHER
ncbi:MAG: MFS transporter, partial [Rhizobiales bacterium 24-66-13]